MNNENCNRSAFEYWCRKVLKKDNTPLNRSHIELAMETLTKRQREYLELVEFNGLPVTEVSRILGVSPSTVSHSVYTTKEKIKKYLKKKNPYIMSYFD